MPQLAPLYPLFSIEQAEYRGRLLERQASERAMDQLADKSAEQIPTLGIRSIKNDFADSTDACQHRLDVTAEFDGRYLAEHSSWSQVYARVNLFLNEKARMASTLQLHMDAHVSLAFAAGWVLNLKNRRRVQLEQNIPNQEAQIWHAQDTPGLARSNWPAWDISYQEIGQRTGKFAVGISLVKGKNVEDDVRHYLSQQTDIQGLLLASLQVSPDQQDGVNCGQHADSLALELEQRLRELSLGLTPQYHFFIAAPNVFTFFLGQRMASLGESTLYEFDYEKRQGGGYKQSLSLAY